VTRGCWKWGVGLLLILALGSYGPPGRAQPLLTISAAASLTGAMQDIKALYLKENPGVGIALNLGGSGLLAAQIVQGAPVDIFAPAGRGPMRKLLEKGLVDSLQVRVFARNRLVLIVPDSTLASGSRSGRAGFRLEHLSDLLRPEFRRIALGNESTVPAGFYAAQTLRQAGLYDRLKPKLIPAEDVRQALQYVIEGVVDAGFVYATDLEVSDPVRVAIQIPSSAHDPIVYPIAPLLGTEHLKEAERFIEFVLGPKGQAVLNGRGFLAPPEVPVRSR
jgi:molybdate transport system substrate-binding protein